MSSFDYDALAEVYSGSARGARTGPVACHRFQHSGDAIRFAIEELSDQMQRGTALEVDDERFGKSARISQPSAPMDKAHDQAPYHQLIAAESC